MYFTLVYYDIYMYVQGVNTFLGVFKRFFWQFFLKLSKDLHFHSCSQYVTFPVDESTVLLFPSRQKYSTLVSQ